MHDLPMALASCALAEAALARQLDRYRAVGRDSVLVARGARQIVVDIGPAVPDELVDELVTVEQSCCPFFELVWCPRGHRLTVAVSDAAHEPALLSIVAALSPASRPSSAGATAG